MWELSKARRWLLTGAQVSWGQPAYSDRLWSLEVEGDPTCCYGFLGEMDPSLLALR